MQHRALHLLVVASVLLAGCSLLGPDHTREERAVEALDDATDGLDSAESYQFASELTVTADSRAGQVDVSLTGAVNVSTRKIRSTATMGHESVRSFVLNRTVYQECQSPWSGWGVEELDDGEWMSHSGCCKSVPHRPHDCVRSEW